MANPFTLDSAWLASKRDAIMHEIAFARYKIGTTWYETRISSAEILDNGMIDVHFVIDHTAAGDVTVTAIELYNGGGVRIGGKAVSISRAGATEGILYACRLSLFQVVENTDQTGAYDAL